MSDFETRLTEALTSGADDAPSAEGLVTGARARARRRRRTGAALVVGLAVAVAVPVGFAALGGDDAPKRDDIAADTTDDAPVGWHTIEYEGVQVDVPGGWQRLDTSSCEFQWERFGPAGSDPCSADGEGLSFYASATFDPESGPGLDIDLDNGSSGYVYAGDWAVWVESEGPREAMRMLGSARTSGQEAPDLSAGFRTVTDNGLSIEVPAAWKEGGLGAWCTDKEVPGWVQFTDTMSVQILCTPHKGYGISFVTDENQDDWIRERGGPNYPEGSWAGLAVAPDENGRPVGFVQVIAPTQGLAELIGGSLRVE